MRVGRSLRPAIIAFIAVFSFGCATSYRSEFLRQAKDAGWTEEQQLAALYASYRDYFGLPGEDGTFTVLYSRLPKEEVTKQLDRFLADLSDVLNYQDEDWSQYIKIFGLRGHFEQREKIFKALRARVRAAELQDVFREMIGEISSYDGEYGNDLSRGYSEYIFRTGNLRDLFPFKSSVIEEAKRNGLLQEIERFSFERQREFDRKEPDPDSLNDPNKFVWRSKKYALEITKYKIMNVGERPENNLGNYEEIYRVVDGKKESAPAVQAFLDGRGGVAVAVIDIDEEKKVLGFGLPDFVEKIRENELVAEEMFTCLFPDEQAYKRIEPKSPPIRVEIARVGEEEFSAWEEATNPDGWMVPLTYKQKPLHDNYSVRIRFRMWDSQEAGGGHGHSDFQVDYITKEWNNGNYPLEWSVGKVVEYYRPKSPYNQTLLSARVIFEEDLKRVSFVFPDGTEKVGFITPYPNIFIEDKPEAIAYTVGNERWIIEDKNHDGKYERRKRITPKLDYDIGIYPYTPEEQSNRIDDR